MAELIKEKKIFYRLLIIALITTPLFGALGGFPFLGDNFFKASHFLRSAYFISGITLLFWVINISFLLLAEKIKFLKGLFPRAIISMAICITLSTVLFHFFQLRFPPPQLRFEGEVGALHSKPNFEIDKKDFTIIGNDSAVKIIGNENFKGMPRHFFFFPQVLHSVTINVIILFLCELIVLYFRKQKIEHENARLRQSNLEAKNNQLKMQLHPHFLFNSLNTLKLLLKKDADKAEDYLLKLSEMLRFSTTSALQDTVDVADELKLCLAYLEMQKVRFGDMLQYNINNPALFLAKGKLPVYSLQLLVENAIKHNAFTTEMPLAIAIDYDELAGVITVSNKLQPKKMMEATTKTGLKNLKERYHLLSNKNIEITNVNGMFLVGIPVLPPNQSSINVV